ncbi:MAG: YbgC/FadM family acyl-CoA thioesterase [Sphingomonadaceae bacterium]|nr:YbgC/FadM family acyl-CoA thioesterase [Sphingomonadaceae bacterium]
MSQPAVHEFALRVYMQDTDASGFVYHANYLAYAERARTEMLRVGRIDHAGMLARGEGVWVVAGATIKYLRPALLDDALVVRSRPIEVGAAHTRIEQRVERGSELLAEITVTVAWLTRGGRPQRQPAEWRSAWLQMVEAAREAW